MAARKDIEEIYSDIEDDIKERISEFKELWEEADDERLFDELVFCLFTPQSKAKVCWQTVRDLREKENMLTAEQEEMAELIRRVRFKNNKASYVIEARVRFVEDDEADIREILSDLKNDKDRREWLVDNVKGLGYKEAGHFLRNIGLGDDLAILDRHILKNLEKLGVIDEIPKSLTPKKYKKIEKKMSGFARDIGIPLGHLDLVLWYKETGEIFK